MEAEPHRLTPSHRAGSIQMSLNTLEASAVLLATPP